MVEFLRSATFQSQEIAVKVIKRVNQPDDFLTKFLPREIEALSRVNHENVIKVFKIFDFKEEVYIFMELARNDMLNYVRDRVHLPENEARPYFREIEGALKYLHSLHIAHRDLKCENIMISEKNKIKIIDFGFCRTTVDKNGGRTLSETYCGSSMYTAPEVLRNSPYNPFVSDVWSLGCVLFVMVTGRTPFVNNDAVAKFAKCQLKRNIEFPFSLILSSQVEDLIWRMLEPDVTRRISMAGVSTSDWFKMEEAADSNDEVGT